MNLWQLVYVVAGVGAIVAILGAIARDGYRVGLYGEPDARPYYAVGLAALVGLWLAAAVLR